MRTVLVIDDSPAVVDALQRMFALHEIRTLPAGSPEEGLALLATQPVDLVIADMNFRSDTTSGAEGEQLFIRIRAAQPDLPIILLTAWASLETAVRLVKAGAADYLAKPWDDTKLLATVENLLELAESLRERQRVSRERDERRRALAERFNLLGLVYASDAMERLVETACRIARAPVPVLITGPNGAGKERIAELIHANSAVASGPLVALNCGAVPPELIEAELFGAEAGAFTGATRQRDGRFDAANGGTLFLDEIGDLPLAGQVKLLRVLESGEFQRLGSSQSRKVHVRVISATNANLAQLIAAGRFREDLFYRLNVIELAVPPLAQRPADILLLAGHFLGESFSLAEDAADALERHSWPGNVRELRNALERAKLLAREGIIRAAELGLPEAAFLATDQAEPDRQTLEAALLQARGNVSRAAQALGLSRQALYRRMDRLGLRER